MLRNEVDYGLAHQMVAFSAVAADESQAASGETSLVSAQVSQADARNEPCRGNAGRRCEELAPVHLEPQLGAGSITFLRPRRPRGKHRDEETPTPGSSAHPPAGRAELPGVGVSSRSEEHTSELQSPCNLVCRLLLEKKK